MMWEIIALKIINALYISQYIRKTNISDVEFSEMMHQVSGRLFEDIKTLETAPETTFSEF